MNDAAMRRCFVSVARTVGFVCCALVSASSALLIAVEWLIVQASRALEALASVTPALAAEVLHSVAAGLELARPLHLVGETQWSIAFVVLLGAIYALHRLTAWSPPQVPALDTRPMTEI